MDKTKYLIIHVDALPDVYEKVVSAKKMIKDGDARGVSEASKSVGISRSTYYKYCDSVFSFAESSSGKRVTINLLLTHESGVLSNLLDYIAKENCSILTISQDAPIDNIANVSITFDVTNISGSFNELIEDLKKLKGIKKLNLIAME